MIFWAIAYQYQTDVFYDFKKQEDTLDVSETCFLPTEDMAKQYIENELSDDYVPVEVKLISLRNGIQILEFGRVERWVEQWEEGNDE